MKKYWVLIDDRAERWYSEDGNVVKVLSCDEEYHWDEDGRLHNENGPAMVVGKSIREYHIHGKRLTKRQWKKWKKNNELADGTFNLLVKMFKAMIRALNELEEEENEAEICNCEHGEKR